VELLGERTVSDVLRRDGAQETLDLLANDVAAKKIDPYSAVDRLLAKRFEAS